MVFVCHGVLYNIHVLNIGVVKVIFLCYMLFVLFIYHKGALCTSLRDLFFIFGF